MENEENFILKAYRGKDKDGTINIDIQKHTLGLELYRICLMLLNQILHMNTDFKFDEKNVDNFFKDVAEDYKDFYMKEE